MALDEAEPREKGVRVTNLRSWLIWVSWSLGSGLGMGLGVLSWIKFDPEDLLRGIPFLENLEGVVIGVSLGTLTGFFQFLVLRFLVRGDRWIAWVPISAAAHAIAYGVLFGFFNSARPLTFNILACGAFMGLIIGGAQAPYLFQRLPGGRWWVWVIGHILWWPMSIVYLNLMDGTEMETSVVVVWGIKGLLMGLFSGAVLAYTVRQTGRKAAA